MTDTLVPLTPAESEPKAGTPALALSLGRAGLAASAALALVSVFVPWFKPGDADSPIHPTYWAWHKWVPLLAPLLVLLGGFLLALKYVLQPAARRAGLKVPGSLRSAGSSLRFLLRVPLLGWLLRLFGRIGGGLAGKNEFPGTDRLIGSRAAGAAIWAFAFIWLAWILCGRSGISKCTHTEFGTSCEDFDFHGASAPYHPQVGFYLVIIGGIVAIISGVLLALKAPADENPERRAVWQVSEPGGAAVTKPRFLEVRDLKVHFPTEDGLVKSVDGVSFGVEEGKTLAIVGESGSGKSVTMQAVMGLHRGTRARMSGQVWLNGTELMSASDETVRRTRGSQMSMIFQDPLSALHPYYTIGNQISEGYLVHHHVSKSEARKRTIEMLDRVGIPNAARRVDQYPHEFSGGMRQRAMIAMALINNPKLLIADEPTTALDVTVQAQILELMKDLQRDFGSAIVMITHDLGVVADIADDVLVMYGGKAVETGTASEVFFGASHPYTWGLLNSMPRLDRERAERLDPIPGTPPSLINLPTGCAFNPRCAFKETVDNNDRCVHEHPDLYQVSPAHHSRCFLVDQNQLGTLREKEKA